MFGFIFVKLYVLHPRTERASFRPDGPNSPSERTPKTAGFRVRTVPTGGFSPFVYIYNIFRSHGAERTRSRSSRSASGIARSLKLTDRITHRKLLVWQHTTLQRAQIYNARNAEALVETPNWKISKARGESRNRSNPRGLVVSVEDFPSPAKTERLRRESSPTRHKVNVNIYDNVKEIITIIDTNTRVDPVKPNNWTLV